MKIIINRDEIKESADLVDVARALGQETKKAGQNYAIRCPHHYNGSRIDQHIGNCYIHNNYFICKACGNSGDILTYIRQVNDCDFKTALSWLSDYTGVPIKSVEEGESYVNDLGEIETAKRLISSKELQFLGIHNEPIYKIVGFTDDPLTDQNLEQIRLKKGVIWLERQLAAGNPLNKLSKSDPDLYAALIRRFVRKKYQEMCDDYEVLKGEYGVADYSILLKDVIRLQGIYSDAGGNIADLPMPKEKWREQFDPTLPF